MNALIRLFTAKEEDFVYSDMMPTELVPYDKPSKLRMSFGKKGSSAGQFNMPCGIAVTNKGLIVIADTENSRIQLFQSDGKLKCTIGEKGCQPQQLHHPQCVALTPNISQNIAVTDSVNACVKVFRQDGSFVAQYTECGDFPYGVAVTSDGFIVVTDLCQYCILVLHPSGRKHCQFGQFGDASNELDHPYFVSCDKRDNIIVSDSGNSCIKMFTIDGCLLQMFSTHDFCLFDENCIILQGLTVDSRGNVLIIGNNTVYICARNGRLWEVILPSDGLYSPKCVAFSEPDQLVITQCGYDNKHYVSVFTYNMDDFKALQIGVLSYKRKVSTKNLEVEKSGTDSQMSLSSN